MTLALPRFQSSAQLVDSNGCPTIAFHIWWNTFAKSIETAFNNLSDQVVAIAAAQAAAAAAQSTATTAVTDAATAQTTATTAQSTATTAVTNAATAQTTANTANTNAATAITNAATAQTTANTANTNAATAITNAATAQTTANTVKRDDSISTSWTSPGTILSAADAGSDATITIANHTRKYTDTTSASVTGGSITGLGYSTTYYVYYDQTSRAGGAVTYNAVTDPNTALANAAAGRHFCGLVTTPAAGGGTTSGGVDPPGGGGGVTGGQIP